ncbi:MAG: acetate kinase, partial [Mesorhizobium sp.]
SLCAMKAGVSLATTMGFSTLDGLVMSTRCGAIDPGVILHLLQERKLSADRVTELLYEQSGLLGVSGISGDMQALLGSKDPAAALGGLDTLVFTAGIGENAWQIRQEICEAAAWLGVVVDHGLNRSGEALVSARESSVDVLVIPADEERAVATQLLDFDTV